MLRAHAKLVPNNVCFCRVLLLLLLLLKLSNTKATVRVPSSSQTVHDFWCIDLKKTKLRFFADSKCLISANIEHIA
jgi:hypothetical protein